MTTFGRGRPPRSRSIGEVTELTAKDLAELPREREAPPSFKVFRDSYHRVAQLAAIGLRNDEIARESGYGVQRIIQLMSDPAMQQCIATYRELSITPEFIAEAREQARLHLRIQRTATRIYADKLDAIENPEDISFRDIDRAYTTFSDRTGFGKVTTTKVQLDLAERMEQALLASGKVIEGRAMKLIEQKKDEAA